MKMVDQQTQQQISDLVNACEGFWELRGIPQERRNEMRLELEQHLEQAVRDGKSLEAVVGPNALALAENWARETPHQYSHGFSIILRWLVFDWLTYALLFLSVIALFEHFVLFSPTFPFSIAAAVSVAFIGMATLLQALAGFLSPRVRSRENRLMLTFGVYAVMGLLVVLVLHLTEAPLHVILFRWDWPLTLLLTIGAGGLFGLKLWFAKQGSRSLRP